MIISPTSWEGQPPLGTPTKTIPYLVFRPMGGRQQVFGRGNVSSSTYTNITPISHLGMMGLNCPGTAGDGIYHQFSTLIDRWNWAIACRFRIDSIASEGTIFALNQQLQVRINTSGQVEILQEAVSFLGASTYAGFTAGTTHTMVLTNRNGGPLVVYSNGVERFRSATPIDGSTVFGEIGFGQRLRGTSQALDGIIFEGALWSGLIPNEIEARQISENYFASVFEYSNIKIPTSILSGAYTLNLETGVYSFTGNAATLTKDSKLTLESGTYTLSGSNASLLKGLILEASSGSYSLSGSDASVLYTHLLNASSGSYSITGSNATLTYTPTSGAYTLNLESGAYLLTGSDVTFISSGAEVTIKAGSWIRYRIIT